MRRNISFILLSIEKKRFVFLDAFSFSERVSQTSIQCLENILTFWPSQTVQPAQDAIISAITVVFSLPFYPRKRLKVTLQVFV